MSASGLLLRVYRDEIRKLLAPGEQLLVLTDYSLAEGKRQLAQPLQPPEQPEPPDQRPGWQKAAEMVAGAAVFLVTGPDPPSVSRMLGGVSAAGHVGSYAYQFFQAYRQTLGATTCLLVTDRRLLLASRPVSGRDPHFVAAAELPRDAVARAGRDPRPLARGRVVIGFADGSMIALKLGTLLAGKAARLAEALSAGRP